MIKITQTPLNRIFIRSLVINSLILTSLLNLSGCSSSNQSDDNRNDDEFSCISTTGQFPPAAASWMDFPQRENSEAEILAMEASLAFSATESLYQQTLTDLDRLRTDYAADPLTAMQATPCLSFTSMLVGFDATTMDSIRTGNYNDWQAINQQYGVASVDPFSTIDFVTLHFNRRFYMPTLIAIYQQASLAGVTSIEGNSTIGNSQDLCLETATNGARYYIFAQGEGDCPAGCITHHYSGYQINGDDSILPLGTHQSGQNAPDWFQQREMCRAFL